MPESTNEVRVTLDRDLVERFVNVESAETRAETVFALETQFRAALTEPQEESSGVGEGAVPALDVLNYLDGLHVNETTARKELRDQVLAAISEAQQGDRPGAPYARCIDCGYIDDPRATTCAVESCGGQMERIDPATPEPQQEEGLRECDNCLEDKPDCEWTGGEEGANVCGDCRKPWLERSLDRTRQNIEERPEYLKPERYRTQQQEEDGGAAGKHDWDQNRVGEWLCGRCGTMLPVHGEVPPPTFGCASAATGQEVDGVGEAAGERLLHVAANLEGHLGANPDGSNGLDKDVAAIREIGEELRKGQAR